MRLTQAFSLHVRRGVLAASLAFAVGVVTLGCAHEPRFADGSKPAVTPLSNELGRWKPPTGRDFASHDHDHDHHPRAERVQVPMDSPKLLRINPAGQSRNWRWIVLHHSATHGGGAIQFDKDHKARGWDELGYHFVIGNGTDTSDGLIEVGNRWRKQKHGAHAKTGDNRFNELGIGICVVGDFDHGQPSAAQMRALTQLTASLMKAYNIPANRVIGHRDTKGTACPGETLYARMPAIRAAAQRAVAASSSDKEPVTASLQ